MTERCPTCKRPYHKNRSNSQNRYYWAVVVKELRDHTGYTEDEIHEILKYKFLSYPLDLLVKENDKETIYVAKSTTSLTTSEMENYLSRIREWASVNLHCFISSPNEEPA